MALHMPMDELVKIVEDGFESEKIRIIAEVEAGFESAKRNMIAKIESYLKDGNHASARTNMKLEFRNGIARTILTGEEIKGEGGEPIEVALIDDSSDVVVDAGPEASADVKIVLLKGKQEGDEWTAEEFNSNIVPEVEGKQPILAGNVTLQLRRGVGFVDNIKFRHHASKIKPPRFKLGARVDGNCHIKEAKTKTFTLKDYRAKYCKKHKNPSLSDEVYRLVCVGKGGEIYKRLKHNKIFTVEDFLIQLLINPEGLKNIVKSQAKQWEAIVNNARACQSGERVYFYMDPEQKTGIIFNILGHVLGLYQESYYPQTSTLSEEQKKKLLTSACKNWEEVKPFHDQNSLEQHLSSLDTYMDDPSPTRASEMVGESSNIYSNASYLSVISTMNLTGEADGQDLLSGCDDDDDDIDTQYDAAKQLQEDWPFTPIRLEVVDGQMYGCSNNLILELNGGTALVDSRSSAPKRWKILMCILRWLMRKRESADTTPCRKKRRAN